MNRIYFCVLLLIFTFLSVSGFCQIITPLDSGFNSEVRTLYYDSASNSLYAGGSFTASGIIPINYFGQWDGTTWNSIPNSNTMFSTTIEKYNQNIITIGGVTVPGYQHSQSFAGWNGFQWNCLFQNDFTNSNGAVYGLYVHDSDLYILGSFDSLGGNISRMIIRYNSSGIQNFTTPLDNYNGSFISTACIYNNELYVGGNFQNQNNPAISDIAKWNGSTWQSVGSGLSGPATFVTDMVVFQGELYIAGAFGSNVSSDPYNGIMKWDGNSLTAVGTGVGILGGTIWKLLVHNGLLYAVGEFIEMGGNNASHLGWWNGMQWDSYPNILFDNTINTIAANGNNLYLGGGFNYVNNIAANKIVKIDITTSINSLEGNEYIKVYPSPAKNELVINIGTYTGKEKLLIINSLGQSVFKKEINFHNGVSESISLINLNDGIYLLGIGSGEHIVTKKLLIKD